VSIINSPQRCHSKLILRLVTSHPKLLSASRNNAEKSLFSAQKLATKLAIKLDFLTPKVP
jgi:hypothetical protein